MTASQPANAYRLAIGDFTLVTLLDSYMDARFELVTGIDQEEVRQLHDASRRITPPRITLNAYLLDTGRQKILFDTGLGALRGEFGGRLGQSMASAGYSLDDIDTVIITHVHPDHVGGLINDDDTLAMPNATVLIPAGELDYWSGEPPVDVAEAQKRQFAAAHRVLNAAGSQIQRLEGEDVLPGIRRVPLPGHTPDHSGYRITSGQQQVLIWTDIVHLPQIQFPNPNATMAFDSDPARAAATRREIMQQVSESREMVAGHHLDFPGIGYVVADGAGFRWLPHVWQPTA